MKTEEILERQRQETLTEATDEYIKRNPVLVISAFYVFTIFVLGSLLVSQIVIGCP